MVKRLLLVAAGLMPGACTNHFRGTIVETLYEAPTSGEKIAASVEYTGHECGGYVPPTVTTWHRAGEPDRILTTHGTLREEKLTVPRVLKPRVIDSDHVVLMSENDVVASFDYGHARAYYGATSQPAWAK
jgi:hypothetical protein